MEGLKTFWNNFMDKHPVAAEWIREGGFYIVISWLITIFKYILLMFLPSLFSAYKEIGWGWPSIEGNLFGITFTFNVIGYAVADGGLAYMFANLISSLIGEIINFPMQRNITFRSHGPLYLQIPIYYIGWFIIFLIVNAINSVWVGVAGVLLPPFIYNIGTTVLTGGVAMVVFFFVNKVIFAPGFGEKKNKA